MYKQLQDALLL